MDEACSRWSRLRLGVARWVARIADGIIRVLGVSQAAGREGITAAELRDLIAASTALKDEQRALISDVLAAAQRHVREVIVPRTEVVFLDAGLTVSQALAQVTGAYAHSRYPVIDGSSDEVIGVVQMRDLVAPHRDQTLTVRALATEIERIPISKPLIAAFAEMRRGGYRIALVVDEYGGTAGIVTLEDLIEGLVGELNPGVAPQPRTSRLDGRTNLASFAERTGLVLPDGPYETVGGFLMATLGRIPANGDEVTVDGWRLIVAEMDGRRVAAVTLVPPTLDNETPPEMVEDGDETVAAGGEPRGNDAQPSGTPRVASAPPQVPLPTVTLPQQREADQSESLPVH